jgi:hypothetical protein
MFKDRDLFLLGAGALLSALCLLLPLAFAGKLIAGALTLVGFMALAFLRLGPDRIPPEAWLLRRLRFWLSPHRFVYHRPGWKVRPPAQRGAVPEKAEATAAAGSGKHPLGGPRLAGKFAVGLALPKSGIYPLVSVWLAVLGLYFVAWLAQGGAQEIAAVFR